MSLSVAAGADQDSGHLGGAGLVGIALLPVDAGEFEAQRNAGERSVAGAVDCGISLPIRPPSPILCAKPPFAPETMRTILPLLILTAALALGACGPQPEPEEQDGAPPLVQAAERGDLQALDHLLGGSGSPDVRDQCRWTPLMKAAVNGHTEAARRLLAAGAQVDSMDKGGYTPLMLAASNDHAQTVALLAANGADLDHAEPGLGWTALIWAAKQGHAATVQTLVEKGADRSLRDNEGKSAALWARQNGHSAVLALLES